MLQNTDETKKATGNSTPAAVKSITGITAAESGNKGKIYQEEEKSFTLLFQECLKKNWERNALTDYGTTRTLRYCDLAEEIERMHLTFREIGIAEGDKIAICGRNSTNWAVAFLASLTYGAVVVPILHEFKPDQACNILEHSESRLVFVNDNLWSNITSYAPNWHKQTLLMAAINLADMKPLTFEDENVNNAFKSIESRYAQAHPRALTPSEVNYKCNYGDSLAIINYTSGSTGKSKGVMIPQRAMWNNVQFALDELTDKLDCKGTIISILPMAHMYGLAFEILSELCLGIHIHFLTKLSPTIIFKAMEAIRPTLVVSVPLVVEKIIRKMVMPTLSSKRIKALLAIPLTAGLVRRMVNKKLTNAFGGKFYEVIIGGAALSPDVEQVLHDIKFRYTVGYGTTECAPLIAYSHWYETRVGSCGRAIPRMEVKIDSPDPQNIVGEILTRGDCVMLGYYKAPELTAEAIDSDGWYHTGDLGVIGNDGSIYIRGRSKNMLLGQNGQNIYPEEIEELYNASPLVQETVIVQRGEKLHALIFPDLDEMEKAKITTAEQVEKALNQVRAEINAKIPAYEQVTGLTVRTEEFEKTPKKSIKRFLYT